MTARSESRRRQNVKKKRARLRVEQWKKACKTAKKQGRPAPPFPQPDRWR